MGVSAHLAREIQVLGDNFSQHNSSTYLIFCESGQCILQLKNIIQGLIFYKEQNFTIQQNIIQTLYK